MREDQIGHGAGEILDKATLKVAGEIAAIAQSRFENLPEEDRRRLIVLYLQTVSPSEFVDTVLGELVGKRSSP